MKLWINSELVSTRFKANKHLPFDSFDGVNNRNLTFEKIKERAEKYNLPILLAYDSFSVAQRKKFGIVFLNSTPLSSFREAEVVQKALMEIFPEAENNCSVLKLIVSRILE